VKPPGERRARDQEVINKELAADVDRDHVRPLLEVGHPSRPRARVDSPLHDSPLVTRNQPCLRRAVMPARPQGDACPPPPAPHIPRQRGQADSATLNRLPPDQVTRATLARALHELGLRPGALVLVHASLKSFGNVEGGAEAVLAALREVLGPGGTLILPAHTDVPEYSTGLYDPATTPVRRDIGLIPEAFWRQPGVRRGRHPPRHPWAARGPLAEGLIELSESRPIGSQHVAGILNAIADLGGWILLLGCTHRSSTTIHTAQVAAYNAVEGATMRRAEFLANFDEVEELLRASGVLRTGRIGAADVRLMRSLDLFAAIQKMYASTPSGRAFKVEPYADQPGFMPASDYPRRLATIRASAAANLPCSSPAPRSR